MALSWSLFGLLAVMCGGLLASLHALVGRMDGLGAELRADMRALRTELTGRMDRTDGRMDALTAEVHGLRAELRSGLGDVDRRLRDGGL